MTTLDQQLQQADRGIDFAQAQAQILATAPAVRLENLPLDQVADRILAAPVIAARDSPPAAVSAMDGYAVRHGDLGLAPLTIQGQTAAGDPQGAPLAPGAAQRIFTGALLPPGADTILIQEDAQVVGDQLRPMEIPKLAAFVRPKGFDFGAGAVLIAAGQRLTPPALALSAAANLAHVTVARAPRVALIATGDELCDLGTAHAPQDVVASNSLALAALLEAAGAHPLDLGRVGDQIADLRARLTQAQGADLVITTGGASVGDFDLVQAALHALGARPRFWQVRVRPGKPVFLWDLDGMPVLGLPGNPVSAYVCARVFALPWVRRALGVRPELEAPVSLPLAAPLAANGPRHQFARGLLEKGQVSPVRSQDSSLLQPLHAAGVLIEREPHAPPRRIGDLVSCHFM